VVAIGSGSLLLLLWCTKLSAKSSWRFYTEKKASLVILLAKHIIHADEWMESEIMSSDLRQTTQQCATFARGGFMTRCVDEVPTYHSAPLPRICLPGELVRNLKFRLPKSIWIYSAGDFESPAE
jgi:hypothetical protein